MKPEKQQLIHDLLGQDGCREATLAAGTGILRRRRRRRIVSQGLAALLVLALAGVWAARKVAPGSSHPVLAQAAGPAVAPQTQALTDEQLLSLFTNTPVALATLSDGKERFIFLHPGDAQKFATRL